MRLFNCLSICSFPQKSSLFEVVADSILFLAFLLLELVTWIFWLQSYVCPQHLKQNSHQNILPCSNLSCKQFFSKRTLFMLAVCQWINLSYWFFSALSYILPFCVLVIILFSLWTPSFSLFIASFAVLLLTTLFKHHQENVSNHTDDKLLIGGQQFLINAFFSALAFS